MKKNNFRGWFDVYGFTFKQATKGIAFKGVTALISIVIIALIIVINMLNAKPDKKSETIEGEILKTTSSIEEVYIYDGSGLAFTDYQGFISQLEGNEFQSVKFLPQTFYSDTQARENLLGLAFDSNVSAIAVMITSTEDGYQIEALIPDNKQISESEANTLVSTMMYCFETNKMLQAGLSNEQLTKLLMPVVTTFHEVGESTDEVTALIKMIVPMIFGLILYFMLLLHGQTISKEVSTEKTSKLMETLLITIHPYALIMGKVLAISSMAIMQFLIWIVSIFIGLYSGNAIAHSIYPTYQNSIVQLIDFLKENIGESAFSLPAVILAIFIFCIGFLFYSVLAGLTGCMVVRPEDVASTASLFQIPIVISWLISYMAPMWDNKVLLTVIRYVPFTSPFSVPVELITGSVSIIEGLIVAVILAIFSVGVISVSARIYKGLVLYNGQKLNFKTIGKVLKAEQNQ